ncbi:MAG: CDP-alcohol phosphatidyltransferase family protein [Clostridia bacterium]|nr:CDP-alcohol phosphatidyltransferase family protein [Clostridia bacterium]
MFTVTQNTDRYKDKIITIPNILSFFRLCLIPIIVWLYCFEKSYFWTTIIFIISGITDIVDGFIARKFDMISDFGKAFDPVADKLTQIAMLFCLVTRFPLMLIPLIILIIKEALAAIMNMITLEKAGFVVAAKWHGKLNTVLIYSMMFIHIVWFNIPSTVSNVLILVCIVMMVVSSFLYTKSDVKAIKKEKE